MIALAYLGAACLYLLLMFAAMRFAWKFGRRDGGSWLKGFLFALGGFVLVYAPVFWNFVPVLLAHRSQCATDAGFRVVRPVSEWIAENRDRFGDLRGVDLEKATSRNQEVAPGVFRSSFFGGFLVDETRSEVMHRFGVNFSRVEGRLVDARTGTPLTILINYSTGSREDIRFWLNNGSCFPSDQSPVFKEREYRQVLKEAVK